MRLALVIAACLAGCSLGGGGPAAPDAAPIVDADVWPDGEIYENRTATGVVVDSTRVAWSLMHGGCPLDSPLECAGVGPTITTAELDVGDPTPRFSDYQGVGRIAGDPDELFMVIERTYVARIRPFAGAALEPVSPVVPVVVGPAVDATHVYWAEGGATMPRSVHRALRDGDGTDATTIASVPDGLVFDMEVAAAFVWWWSADVMRVPVTGGTPAVVVPRGRLVGRSGDLVYASRAHPADAELRQILTIGADGVPVVLVDELPPGHEPAGPIATEGTDLYWIAANGRLVHLSTTTGTIEELDVGFVSGVFALVPGAILVDFTRDGYRSIPR